MINYNYNNFNNNMNNNFNNTNDMFDENTKRKRNDDSNMESFGKKNRGITCPPVQKQAKIILINPKNIHQYIMLEIIKLIH